jgi:hypothetical protein
MKFLTVLHCEVRTEKGNVDIVFCLFRPLFQQGYFHTDFMYDLSLDEICEL